MECQQKEIFYTPVDQDDGQGDPQPHRRQTEGLPLHRGKEGVGRQADADVETDHHRVQYDGMIKKREDGMSRQKQIYCPCAAAAGAVYLRDGPEHAGIAARGQMSKDIF